MSPTEGVFIHIAGSALLLRDVVVGQRVFQLPLALSVVCIGIGANKGKIVTGFEAAGPQLPSDPRTIGLPPDRLLGSG